MYSIQSGELEEDVTPAQLVTGTIEAEEDITVRKDIRSQCSVQKNVRINS